MDSTEGEGNGTVLVVEDDSAVLKLLRMVLEKRGLEVLEATSVDRAMELAEEYRGRIRLLITDLIMPQLNGRKLADRILEGDPAIAVLFMSGYTDDYGLRHDVATSDAPFIQKPFNVEQLLHKVRVVLNAPR